jgi:hypothetical protein
MLRQLYSCIPPVLVLLFATPFALADGNLTVKVESPQAGTVVPAGDPVTVTVKGTFDQVLAGTTFDLTPTGPAATGASITARTVATGLNHLGTTTGDPWDGDLPLALTGGTAMKDVLVALLTAHRPGSADDGLAPATDLDLVTYGVKPTNKGTLTLTLANPSAATTQFNEDGTVFDTATVEPAHASVSVTVTPRADLQLDLDVDLADFAVFQRCFGQTPTGACAQADQDQDGNVNMTDANTVLGCLAGPGQTPACP